MPRKRKTRAVGAQNRAPAKVPNGSEGSDLREAERREKVETLLEDFAVEMEEKIRLLREQANIMAKKVESEYKKEVLKLPQNIKNMKLIDFLARGGHWNNETDELIQFEKDLAAQVSSATKHVLQPIAEEDNSLGKKKGIKKARQANRKNVLGTVGTNQSVNMPPPTTGRQRRTRLATKAFTPANQNASTSGWDTPLVTPKFNPRLPTTPSTGLRKVVKGERVTIVSAQTGSPVNMPSIALPIGPEEMVMVHDDDLDEESKQMIVKLKQRLMLMAK